MTTNGEVSLRQDEGGPKVGPCHNTPPSRLRRLLRASLTHYSPSTLPPTPPKLLNDYDVSAGQFRGGLSFLSRQGTVLLASHQTNASSGFSQAYGVGYYAKVRASPFLSLPKGRSACPPLIHRLLPAEHHWPGLAPG